MMILKHNGQQQSCTGGKKINAISLFDTNNNQLCDCTGKGYINICMSKGHNKVFAPYKGIHTLKYNKCEFNNYTFN